MCMHAITPGPVLHQAARTLPQLSAAGGQLSARGPHVPRETHAQLYCTPELPDRGCV